MALFNPPPSWPAPPPGWQPPRGWTPDPSWPAPPPGWQLWLDDTAARRERRTASARAGARPSGRMAAVLTAGLACLGAAVVLAPSGQLPVSLDSVDTVSSAAGLGTTTEVTPSPTPELVTTLGCPDLAGSGSRSATFTHATDAAAPYSVSIDYGDGKTYAGDSAHPAAVFSHTYAKSGSYVVTAVVTDSAGHRGTGTCSTGPGASPGAPSAAPTPTSTPARATPKASSSARRTSRPTTTASPAASARSTTATAIASPAASPATAPSSAPAPRATTEATASAPAATTSTSSASAVDDGAPSS